MNKNIIRRISESILFEERKEENVNEINYSKLSFINIRKQRSLYGKMGLEEIILVSKDIKGVKWYYFNELDDIYAEIKGRLISIIGLNHELKSCYKNWKWLQQEEQLLFIHEAVYDEFIKKYDDLQADDEFLFQYWRGIARIVLKKPYKKTIQLGKFKTQITIQEEGDIDIEKMSLKDLEEFLKELEEWLKELEKNEPDKNQKDENWEDLWNQAEEMIEEVQNRIEELDEKQEEIIFDDLIDLNENKDFECHLFVNDEAVDEFLEEAVPYINKKIKALSEVIKRFKG